MLRWLPAVAVPALIAIGVVAVPMQAGASSELPAKTPEQVVEMVAQSSVRAFSGTVEQTSNLGLPELPKAGPTANSTATSALEFLTGSHTARVYIDGSTNARVQVMDTLAERDMIRHGNDVWLYTSADNTATHLSLPSHEQESTPAPGGSVQTPSQLAAHFLAAIDPSTTVTVGNNISVAGRTAYDLVLTPKTTDTLVGSVSIAVDSQTGLPLSVDVQARGQSSPAFQVAFSQVSLTTPAASLFTFTPPPGATVKQQALPAHATKGPADAAASQATVTGTGWASVISLPASAVPAGLLDNPLLAQATSSVTGGRLLSTSLVNVYLTRDGRVFAGAVGLPALQSAAAAK